MQIYKNLNGNSGVSAYEIGESYIKVQFQDGSIYLYDYVKPGKLDVEAMKQLAIKGSGLNSYIGTHIKKNYSAKLR
jgi:hypothetical protein